MLRNWRSWISTVLCNTQIKRATLYARVFGTCRGNDAFPEARAHALDKNRLKLG